MADFTALKSAIQTYIKQNGNEEITGEKLQEILLSVVTTLGDSAINDLVTALNDEVAARQNADGTLQQNITNEATARANGDTALSNRLGSSITTENTAADQIGAEAEARTAADTALQNLIDGITENIENGYVYAGIATPSSTPATGKVFYLALTADTYTNFGSIEVSQGINILKYNGSAWSLDAFIGIDDTPTPNSPKLVKSGGVYDNIDYVSKQINSQIISTLKGNNNNLVTTEVIKVNGLTPITIIPAQRTWLQENVTSNIFVVQKSLNGVDWSGTPYGAAKGETLLEKYVITPDETYQYIRIGIRADIGETLSFDILVGNGLQQQIDETNEDLTELSGIVNGHTTDIININNTVALKAHYAVTNDKVMNQRIKELYLPNIDPSKYYYIHKCLFDNNTYQFVVCVSDTPTPSTNNVYATIDNSVNPFVGVVSLRALQSEGSVFRGYAVLDIRNIDTQTVFNFAINNEVVKNLDYNPAISAYINKQKFTDFALTANYGVVKNQIINQRIKELYLPDIDTSKYYYIYNCKYNNDTNKYQFLVGVSDTLNPQSLTIYASIDDSSTPFNGVISLRSSLAEGSVFRGYAILDIKSTDTAQPSSNIVINNEVIKSLDYNPGILARIGLSDIPVILRVGITRQFTTLKSCCEYIWQNDINNATVYVDAETFDLVSEFGQSYLDNYDGRSFGLLIGKNTHFIFAEGSKIVFDYQGENEVVAEWFSPFNVYGSFILENANIWVRNARYCIHDDYYTAEDLYKSITGAATGINPINGYIGKYINCVMHHDGDTIGSGSHLGYSNIGAGTIKNSLTVVHGGVYTHGADNAWPRGLSFHNFRGANDPSRVIIKDVYCDRKIRFGVSLTDANSIIDCEVSNSKFTGFVIATQDEQYVNLIDWNNDITQ